jgi:TM2 domain-containing membrane protein YozV
VRNNFSQPSIGHVIMFAGVTVGWLLLFLITLASSGSSTFWIKVVFSGLLMTVSAVGTVLILVRVIRNKRSDQNSPS